MVASESVIQLLLSFKPWRTELTLFLCMCQDHHTCQLAKEKTVGFPASVSHKATLKAFVKLECCFQNRIKAQFFFLCSQINIQKPIKAGGQVLDKKKKCLMSEEPSSLKSVQNCSPLLSMVIIALLSCSDCWWWHHCHRIRRLPGTALASTAQSSICSEHKHTQLTIPPEACAALKLSKQRVKGAN